MESDSAVPEKETDAEQPQPDTPAQLPAPEPSKVVKVLLSYAMHLHACMTQI